MKRPTMNDIAAAVGLSNATVCRALQSDPRVTPETQKRVRDVAAAMGYVPDPLISAFVRRRRGKVSGSEVTTIAYITNFPTANGWTRSSFYVQCFEGAKARARELGYQVEHFWLREPGMTAARLSQVLYNRGIGALVIAPTPQVRGHLSLSWHRFSTITIAYSVLRPAIHRVAPHHYHGILLAIRELRKLGYRRIGFSIFGPTNKRSDELWQAGGLIAREHHAKLPVFLFDDRTLPKLAAWCRKERLEVLIGGDPIMLTQLRRSKVNIPGELDYATVDWQRDAPEIAGIDQRPSIVGATAIELLIGQQQRSERGIPKVPLTTMVEGQWMHGESLSRKPAGVSSSSSRSKRSG